MAQSSVRRRLLNWLLGPVAPAYFDGHNAYSLAASSRADRWVAATQLPACLVLSRTCYQEETRTFPALDLDELKVILKLEYPDLSSVRYRIVRSELEVSRRHVTVWRLKPHLNLAARVWIPETYLLAESLQKNQILKYESGVDDLQTFWLGHSPRGGVSTPVTPAIHNARLFAMGAALPELAEAPYLDSRALAGALINSLQELPVKEWLNFLPHLNIRDLLPKLAVRLAPLMITLSVYLGLSSAYLIWQKQTLNEHLGAVTGDVAKLLDSRTRYENSIASLTEMSEWLNRQSPFSSAWLVLRPLLDSVRIEILRTEYSRIVISGTAPRATEVLERLSADPRVKDARFDEATSQSGNRDYFTISFVLNNNGVGQ